MHMNRTVANVLVRLRVGTAAVSILVRLHAYRQNSSTNVGEIANGQNRNKRLRDSVYGQLETAANVFRDIAKGQLETAANVLLISSSKRKMCLRPQIQESINSS